MCGIAGIFDSEAGRRPDDGVLQRMNAALRHRGPDGEGYHVEPGIGLAHRRLSIIDIALGKQPLYNEDGSVAVVYNGEIFNFRELTSDLIARGHAFQTHSDTEVIVHAWEEWGPECVRRFRGMFAIALWDRSRGTLFLARDRLGVKPLHYALLPGGSVVFASELKGILAHPGFRRELNPPAVEEYFTLGYVPEPGTIVRNAWKLPPAHTLLLRRGQPLPEPVPYWDIPFQPLPSMPERVACEELVARLREAVDIRLISEVPLGAFLSGGIDSSAVVAMMAGLSPEPVTTCSIEFTEQGFSEGRFAGRVARQFATRHHERRVAADDFDLVDRIAGIYDEPFADSSALPTYRVCQLAREHVTVALSGDGGDENFAGYRRYRWHLHEEALRSRLPRFLRKPLFGAAARFYPKADWAPKPLRAKSTFEALALDTVDAYCHSVSLLREPLRSRLLSASLRRDLQGYRAVEVFRRHARNAPSRDPLSLVQYLDLKTYLVGDILTKVDRASMAHSLEVRTPFLDHPFVEWVSGLPPQMKLRGRDGKYLLKKALEPVLPHEILYRQKMGFAVPLALWFRGPLRDRVRETLWNGWISDSNLFDPGTIRSLVTRHESGASDFSSILWALLIFESSLRNVLEVDVDAGSRIA